MRASPTAFLVKQRQAEHTVLAPHSFQPRFMSRVRPLSSATRPWPVGTPRQGATRRQTSLESDTHACVATLAVQTAIAIKPLLSTSVTKAKLFRQIGQLVVARSLNVLFVEIHTSFSFCRVKKGAFVFA